MSYRTFKRVLGETNLERKCRWWFGISLFVLLTLSFTWYGQRTDELVEERIHIAEPRIGARRLAEAAHREACRAGRRDEEGQRGRQRIRTSIGELAAEQRCVGARL